MSTHSSVIKGVERDNTIECERVVIAIAVCRRFFHSYFDLCSVETVAACLA